MSELAILGGTPVRTEPFHAWPVFGQEEIDAAARAIRSGKWGHGTGGDEVPGFEREYAAFHGAKYGVAVHTGTSAIRAAVAALGVSMGDEVIAPAYTFIGTVTPVMELGAVPVFVDIDPDTYNIDPAAVEAAITPRTVGIIPVHFAGLPANLDAITAIAEKHGLWVMEDAAQAWGSEWKGTGVGHIGACGIFSFQSSKNITAGEGGIVITDDEDLAETVRSFVNCGRSSKGKWYGHYRVAGNYRLSEMHGAVLRAQLERYPSQLAKRQKNAARLIEGLSAIPGMDPLVRADEVTAHSYHLFIWRYRPEELAGVSRGDFMKALHEEGIPCSPGYSVPLYEQPVFTEKNFDPAHAAQAVDFTAIRCEVADRACKSEGLWLTQQILLGTDKDMDDIVAGVAKVVENADKLKEAGVEE